MEGSQERSQVNPKQDSRSQARASPIFILQHRHRHSRGCVRWSPTHTRHQRASSLTSFTFTDHVMNVLRCSSSVVRARGSPAVRTASSMRVGRTTQPHARQNPRHLSSSLASSARVLAVATEEAPVEALPRWDLEQHFGFAGPMDTSMDKAFAELESSCVAFKAEYEGQLGTKLYAAVLAYESIEQASPGPSPRQ